MATTTMIADSPRLKRSLTPDLSPNTPYSGKKLASSLPDPVPNLYSPKPPYPNHTRRHRGSKKARPVSPGAASMPMSTPPKSFAAMPSMMSVFGDGANTSRSGGIANHNKTLSAPHDLYCPASTGDAHPSQNSILPFSSLHHHRDSTSTSNSDSSDSSPTTTVSTVDSSSMTEPSPGPSPESPSSKTSPSYMAEPSAAPAAEQGNHGYPPQPLFALQQRSATPPKKPRNLKNLAVNTSNNPLLGRAISTAPFHPADRQDPITTSAPSSPAFVKPPTPPRKRPNNLGLSIMTPSNSNLPTRLAIPPTPSFSRPGTLRHFQSSPSLPLCTPSMGPEGGMQLPPLRPLRTNAGGFAEVLQEHEEDDPEPNYDVPQSREEKPDPYPDGPIQIYESGVWLFLEPTAQQASSFDVVFNVASEVKNPFMVIVNDRPSSAVSDDAVIRKSADNIVMSNSGLFEDSLHAESPSTTPKATPLSSFPRTNGQQADSVKHPEYIHIPWEHNTDIVPDLLRLVREIDERVQKGKRVLVHCQCGVSRSASLIVAYGLFKNPGMSVQEAYDAVKKRSKWIGPNMNLIMQLQEFRSKLLREQGASRKSNNHWGAGGTSDSPFELETGNRTPRTAPLPPDPEAVSPQRASTGNMVPVSAGAALASPSPWSPGYRRSWGAGETSFGLSSVSIATLHETPYVDPAGHVVPVVTVAQPEQSDTREPEESRDIQDSSPTVNRQSSVPNFSRRLTLRQEPDGDFPMSSPPLNSPSSNALVSPRSEEFAMTGMSNGESGDLFGILSPMKSEFPKQPFVPPPSVQSRTSGLDSSLASFEFAPAIPSEPRKRSSSSTIRNVYGSSSAEPRSIPEDDVLPQPGSEQRSNTPKPVEPVTTPARPLQKKFSSPDLHTQRRLQALQAEMETHLTTRSRPPSDDFDTLQSPRAEEFTMNPFHIGLGLSDRTIANKSPAPETMVLNSPTNDVFSDRAPGQVDPRSPPQKGGSPIVRNIWDVL